MKVEDDGSLTIHPCDLLDSHRFPPPGRPLPEHFTREARIAAGYAVRAGYPRVSYVAPDVLEVMEHDSARWWKCR